MARIVPIVVGSTSNAAADQSMLAVIPAEISDTVSVKNRELQAKEAHERAAEDFEQLSKELKLHHNTKS